MSLEAWKDIFEIGGVVLLAFTFVFGAGALIVNKRVNAIQAKELDNFRLKFEAEQQKTALAQKEAAEARQLAGGFQRDIAAASQRAAEANEKAESEKLARVKLERQLSPRRLTGAQKETFTSLLAAHPDAVAIVSTILDGEGSDFADDFDMALKAAHWQTLKIKNHISDKYGVRLGTVAGTTLPGTRRLQDALTAIGVPYEQATFSPDDHTISPWFQGGVIYLVIERRPEPKVDRPQ
jgi:hypothetical protein